MRALLNTTIILLLLEFLFQRCANPASPSGGPRDTIPPVLLESYPRKGATNFQDHEFTLTFSEMVAADQLSQKLITTPKSDLRFKTFTRKNVLTIKFEGDFLDSTTYNLNFVDGVVDVTERNPVENLSIAFSTGSYIDSMKIKGVVKDLFTQEPAKKITIGLYPQTDSLDLLKDSPLYFTTTSDSGTFLLDYIKSSTYKLLAFKDENRNIVFDPDTESHGFLPGLISLDSTINLKDPINVLLQNVTPIKFINSRSIGPYVELKYNKEINSYTINPNEYQHNIIGENKDGIRIYRSPQTILNDSITFILHVKDSLGNIAIDTIKNIFQDNYRKPTTYSISTTTQQLLLSDSSSIDFTFNKPSFVSDSIGISLTKDSTISVKPRYKVDWNENHTKAKISLYLSSDSVIQQVINTMPKDSTRQEEELLEDYRNRNYNMNLDIKSGSFYSVEQDTSKSQTIKIRTKESKSYGTIKLQVDTDQPSFIIQLLDKSKVAQYSIKNDREPVFPKVTPGNYTIRILIDTNVDDKWSVGNLLYDIPPEAIYIHPESTTVRENWVQEINISF